MNVYIGNMIKITNTLKIEKYSRSGCPKCKTTQGGSYCINCGSKIESIEYSDTTVLGYYDLKLKDEDEFYCIAWDNDEYVDPYMYIGFNIHNDYYTVVEEDYENDFQSIPKKLTEKQCKELWKNLIEACEKKGLTYSFEYGIIKGDY